jgi:hypothetical protein
MLLVVVIMIVLQAEWWTLVVMDVVCSPAFGIRTSLPLEVCSKHAHDRHDFGSTWFAPRHLQTKLQQVRGLDSGSALFIKTKNHVRACPLLKHPCIHFIFAKIKQYTYKSHCFKIHFHMYTRVQKQMHKLCIICVQMFGNAKI